MKCNNCNIKKDVLICLPMYGYLCSDCYKDIYSDYLK